MCTGVSSESCAGRNVQCSLLSMVSVVLTLCVTIVPILVLSLTLYNFIVTLSLVVNSIIALFLIFSANPCDCAFYVTYFIVETTNHFAV